MRIGRFGRVLVLVVVLGEDVGRRRGELVSSRTFCGSRKAGCSVMIARRWSVENVVR